MSVVHYKFKNNLDYKTISFDGLSISLDDLKRAIMAQNKTKHGEFRLEIKNAQTSEVYKEDTTQIPKNASVVIRRIPTKPVGKALTATERPESPGNLSAKPNEGQDDQTPPTIPLSKLNKVADLANANASEDDKISAMMNQAGEDWDPSLYAKGRGRYSNLPPRAPPPAHYLCFRCRKPGHWIQNCPTNGDPNYDMKVRRTTGIPKSFLRLADNPTQKGALLIAETGQYAVPIVDHFAYEQAATRKKTKDVSTSGMATERAIPREYLCPICKKVMANAVVIPCCGESFCDECVVSSLLEKEHVCPLCGSDNISPASIVINKHLRQAIIKFRSSKMVSFSAPSSALHRDGETVNQEKSSAPALAPATTSTVTTSTSVTVAEEPPSAPVVVTTSPESSQVKSKEPSPNKSSEVTTTTPSTQPGPNGSQTQDPKKSTAVSQDAVSNTMFPRVSQSEHQVSEAGYVHPLRMPGAVSHQPMHRPSYVVSGSGMAHAHPHHHAMVHPTVPSLGIPAYGRLSHPALLPGAPALPFGGPDMGMMMNEGEFYLAKMKLAERGRRKRRSDDDKKRKKDLSRSSHRRERRESPSCRRSPSGNDFALELSNYQSMQRDRLLRRSRSRSWTQSGSSSCSNSSWSHSWSRSKSPSRSYSRSKSRTPVNWDRSRSPSPDEKPVDDGKKRRKYGKDPNKKRFKVDATSKDDVEKASENAEARSATPAETKSDGKAKEASVKEKEEKEKNRKKNSRKKESGDAKEAAPGKREGVKHSGEEKQISLKEKKGKGDSRSGSPSKTSQSKTKQKSSRDSSPLVKISKTDDKRRKGTSRGSSPVEQKTEKEKSKTEYRRGGISISAAEKRSTLQGRRKKEMAKSGNSDSIEKKKEEKRQKEPATSGSTSIYGKTAVVKDKRKGKTKSTGESKEGANKKEITGDKKKESSKRDALWSRESDSKLPKSSTKEKTSIRLDGKQVNETDNEKQVKKRTGEVSRTEKREKNKVELERKGSLEKQKKRSVSSDAREHGLAEGDVSREEAKVKKREGKKKKRKKSVVVEGDEKDADRNTSRKRAKGEENEIASELSDKVPKKKKKKRHSVEEEQVKDSKAKKRKHKKQKKHRHKKKTKHREKEKKREDKEKSAEDSGNEEDEDSEGARVTAMDDEGHSGGEESSRTDRGLSDDSGGKEVETGTEEDDGLDGVKGEEKDSEDGGSLQGDEEMESGDDGDDREDDADMANFAEELEEVDPEEAENQEVEDDEEEEEVAEYESEEVQGSEEEQAEELGEEEDSDVEVYETGDEEEEEDMDEIQHEGDDEDGTEVLENDEMEEEVEYLEENEETKDDISESEDEEEILGNEDSNNVCDPDDVESDEALLEEGAGEEEQHLENDIEELLEEYDDNDDVVDDACDDDDVILGEEHEADQDLDDVTKESLNGIKFSPEVKGKGETGLLSLKPGDVLSDLGHGNENEVFVESGKHEAFLGPSEENDDVSLGDNEVTVGHMGGNEVTLGHSGDNEVTLGHGEENEISVGPDNENEASVNNEATRIRCVDKPEEDVRENKANVSSGSKGKISESLGKSEQKSQQLEENSSFGVKCGRITTRPQVMKYQNYDQFDSGVGTLSSLDSLPEFDDPNYTDFGADPVPRECRRSSIDIFRALIEEETESDF